MKQKHFLKRGIIFLLGSALLFSVSGCGNSDTIQETSNSSSSQSADESEAASESAPAETTHLTMNWLGGEESNDYWIPLIEKWNSEHPEIQISGEMWDTDSEEKLRIALMSGNAPDIIMMGAGWVPAIVNSGDYLLDFNQQDILDLSEYNTEIIKEMCEINGIQAALPASYATITMCVNMTACEKYGVTIEDGMTIDELYAIGQKLHEEHPEAYLYNVHEQEVYELFRALLRQQVSDDLFTDDYTANVTEEDLRTVFEIIKRGYDTGTFQPIAEAVGSSPDGACLMNEKWINSEALIVSNASGGIIYSISFVEGNEDMQFSMFTLPRLSKDNDYGSCVLTSEKVWGIPTSCQNQSAALTFLNWLVNSTEAVDLLQGDALGGVYATKPQLDYSAEQGYSNPYITEGYEKAASSAIPYDNEVSLNTSLNDILRQQVLRVAYMYDTPEDCAAETMELLLSQLEVLKSEAE